MAEFPTRFPEKPLLPTDWYPMNRNRRYAPIAHSTSTLPTPTSPTAKRFIQHILNARDSSLEEAAEKLNAYIDEFNYIIGDNGQKMLIAGITSLKHSAEDIAVAFQTYWFSDVVEGGKALKCDEVVISKAFKSIEDGSKNTWFFQKFSKGGEGFEEALALLEVGICCAYGEVDVAAEGEDSKEEEEDGVDGGDVVKGGNAIEEEDAVEEEDVVEGEDVVEEEDLVDGEDAVEGEDAIARGGRGWGPGRRKSCRRYGKD